MDVPSAAEAQEKKLCLGFMPLKTATKSIALFQVVIYIAAVVGFTAIIGRHGGDLMLKPSSDDENPNEFDGASPTGKFDIRSWSRDLQPQDVTHPPEKNGDAINKKAKKSEQGEIIPFPMWVNLIIFTSIIITLILLLMASINLFKGARDKIQRKCKIWMIVNIGLFLLVGIVFGVLCFLDVGTIILGLLFIAEIQN
ncbi:uncharacterized protein LOC110857860 isoform X2 [Folsomia candida]|uniref:uncharacterized protein LOC110857860 isoform X2 n=1 Tax=Folsomia candida TaxID=158441 RepID=UPI001604CD6C|nr:uncharacterized protein LOC110857860 isoform X2 [Folsomia candida]